MPPVKQPGVTREEIMRALARGYCAERNTEKEMDIDLVVAMADEVQKLIEDEYGSILSTEGH
jgi:hypothetical protein